MYTSSYFSTTLRVNHLAWNFEEKIMTAIAKILFRKSHIICFKGALKVQVNPGRSLFDRAMKPFALSRLGHQFCCCYLQGL